jgi:hypothetical protein
MCTRGSPRNLGEPWYLRGPIPAGLRETKVQAHSRGRPHPVGANERAQPRYRQAKETKCGGKDPGRRSTLIVPGKRGNHPEGPRGGKGGVGSRNRWRER